MTGLIAQPKQPRTPRLIHNVTWEQLEEIDESLQDFPGLKLIYLDELLEIRPIGEDHENVKSTMGILLESYLRARRIRFYRRGGPTLGRKEDGARNEPDESYSLGTRGQYPDLVFEVVFTSGGVDRLEGYRRMGVKEVWFWESGIIKIFALEAEGYREVETTGLIPDFPLQSFLKYISYPDQFDAVDEFLNEVNAQQ